jgi:hypothetical protein
MTTSSQSAAPALIGRKAEQAELLDAAKSGRPELIAVYGRRRIGKTHLIRTFFAKQICFELTGVREARAGQQLKNFAHTLESATKFKLRAPRDWPEAFQELIRYLDQQLRTEGRKVVFLDEVPWLAGRRSGFLPAFEYFWNSWGSRQAGLIVVICGSAASWMITKVLHQKGGLHNRITRNIPLQPFCLPEAEEFLKSRGVALDRKQVIELVMAVGGVAYYLDYARKGRSAAQIIESLFFAPNAPLLDEFGKLFAALFENHQRHLKVIRALARKQAGLSRKELIEVTRFETGGNLTTILDELEASGFICRMVPFGHTKRDPIYRLIDELTLFHLRWVEGKRDTSGNDGRWSRIRSTPAWHAWSGYAFENLCLKHVDGIKKSLGISGVQTECASWRHRPSDPDDTGAQIDLLIDRKDGVINVCEMKFSEGEFCIDKAYARDLRNKLGVFRRVTGTRKSLFLTLVTTFGISDNTYQAELVQNSLTAESLFER